jgi:hypothetical protein
MHSQIQSRRTEVFKTVKEIKNALIFKKMLKKITKGNSEIKISQSILS